ncbi:MAG: DeoR/GlpR family DNA-binding transcription regulator [Clostridiales bacterium]|jgi:DeoR/GlpR family transcriptional regulator of sugar metabolism|nr:DeoR/GlpR family DNA-binding transcription regulator [Clostridiales bacterium]
MIDLNKLMDFIRSNDYTTTRELCAQFGISESTARRALDKLVIMGKVTRLHGGAMPASVHGLTTEFQMRNAMNKEQKISIARTAAQHIQPYSTVILMGGTTVCEMCAFIDHMNITVVTNSILVLNGLKYSRNVRLILLGGLYNYQEEEVGGLLMGGALGDIHADQLFTCASGFDEIYGISTTNASIELYHSCIEASTMTCVLADSSKYMKGGAGITARLDQVQYIFTDNRLDERAKAALECRGVRVVIA